VEESFLYDNTIGDGPYNAWIDPMLTNEWQMYGWNNVQEMTRLGMPGVFAHGQFDTWSPGYLMFIAAITSTVEPEGCPALLPASPAAMRPRDGWKETPNQ